VPWKLYLPRRTCITADKVPLRVYGATNVGLLAIGSESEERHDADETLQVALDAALPFRFR
jgi:hypothetical protein